MLLKLLYKHSNPLADLQGRFILVIRDLKDIRLVVLFETLRISFHRVPLRYAGNTSILTYSRY
jgi:hypothetical protein